MYINRLAQSALLLFQIDMTKIHISHGNDIILNYALGLLRNWQSQHAH